MNVESNPRRRRRKSSKRRSRRRNPSMSLRRPLGALTSGFKTKSVGEALPIAGGILANFLAQSFVSSRFPSVSSGIASYGVGIALAGVSGLVPKYGPKLFVGGMAFQVLRVINSFLPDKVRLGDLETDDWGNRIGMDELIERPAIGMGEIMWSTGQPSQGAVILD